MCKGALMSAQIPSSMLQLESMVTADGRLELSIAEAPTPAPGPDEVLIRVEAAPINPSDLALLLAFADLDSIEAGGTPTRPTLSAPVPPQVLAGLQARIDQPMTVGNEGCGTVVAAGSSDAAQALLGRRVAFVGGSSYSQYRTAAVFLCLELPDDTAPEQGASCFVNPLTALGMVETMRREGHTGLVHTAAASNLGQMLNRICLDDGVPLVNIVRRAEQAELLRSQGAVHVVDSSSPNFRADLIDALGVTGATLAFDAIGGGRLASDILAGMEAAATAAGGAYSRYGSDTHKQLYIYGGLDRSATTVHRTFGFAWGIGGWLLTPFLGKAGIETVMRMRARVVAELTTTFASHYTDQISLAGALAPDTVRRYARQATGEKFLIRPDAH